jgi:membrane fusion protein, heavy metal efflux system
MLDFHIMNSNFCTKSVTLLSLLSIWVSFVPLAFGHGGHSHGNEFGGQEGGSSEVKIDSETALRMGIKVAPVEKQKLPVEIVATGQLDLLPNQKVEVTSPIKGKILQLLVQPGTRVKAGQPLATMTSPELGDLRVAAQEKKSEATASLQQAQAELKLAQENYRKVEQLVKADREQALSQLAVAQSRLSREQQLVKNGSLVQVAKTSYQRQQQISKAEIAAAQTEVNVATERYQQDLKLAAGGALPRRQVLESQAKLAEARSALAKAQSQPGLLQAETELRKAETELPLRELREAEKQVAEAKGQLNKSLYQKSFIEAESQLRKAQSAVTAAQNRQNLSAATYNTRMAQLGNIDNQNGLITIKSPIEGTVADRDITTGQSVADAGAKIMTITDDRQVMATANIYEKDLGRVKLGQEAKVKVGNEMFAGTVSRIGTAVEGQSRVVPVQVAISNNGTLKAGMFAELRLITDESTEPIVAVPLTAIVEAEGKKMVYVQGSNAYQSVPVTLGQTIGDFVEVKTGLFVGDQVVIQRAMQLYAQSLKAPAHNHDHGDGAAKPVEGKISFNPLLLAIPGALATAGGAWWIVKKRKKSQDGAIDVEVLAAEDDLTVSPVNAVANMQTDITDVEVIAEDVAKNADIATASNGNNGRTETIVNKHDGVDQNIVDRVLITPANN